MSLIMEVSQRTVLHTQLLILMILLIILGYSYGTVNEDEPQVQETKQHGIEKAGGREWLQERQSKTSGRTCYKNRRWVLGNPKATVAMTDYEGLRRARDVGLNNPNGCYPDEYYSEDFGRCRGCTRCSPGTQHDPQLSCGHGQGQETHCTPCQDGYYQSREGLPILTCQSCSQCDPRAIVERACTQRRNTVCGKCQKGWYYRENNICEECTEADMADPSNKDCYQEPDPTPGSKPTPEPSPSTTAPLQNGDEVFSESAVMSTTGKIVEMEPQNRMDPMYIALIVTVTAALCAALVVCVVLYRLRNKKRNVFVGGLPPEHNEYELDPLRGQGDQEQNHQTSGSCDEGNNSMHDLVHPSSRQSSSPNRSDSSDSQLVDPMHDGGEDPTVTKNFVKRDTEVPLDTNPQPSTYDGPLSGFGSLRSYDVVADGAGSQVPDMPAGGSQLPAERVNPSSGVSNREDPPRNYDVAPDPSLPSGCRPPSGFNPLSSLPQHNNPRPPQTRV